jgi:hypothetical protein
MAACHCQWCFAKISLSVTSFFFYFSIIKKKLKDVSRSDVFPTGAWLSQVYSTLSLKKMKDVTFSDVFAQIRQ